ncbi:DUF2977 domain-containing protein [Staphylococcus xylosus]|uniref:DUF2977 domain-containing protein n=1 Tax=Staphylococcus xylosus TaxID=1288 RepID=UPI0015C57A37|nr:DUF2977 domain-containing protein [Staphylococcus xylosus]NQD98152.1 DUF2977 domain-containing protein [Staphylococcus xylosus]
MENEQETVDIRVNDKNEIIAYAFIGGVGGVEVSKDILPEHFRENYDYKYYLFVEGEISKNPDYKEPIDEM